MIYRTMQEAEDGRPVIEASAEGLGVRKDDDPYPDIEVVDGFVSPGNGMSVSGDPSQMPKRRRHPQYGGKSKMPLFGMEEGDLPNGLSLFPPFQAGHMVLQPTWQMPIDDYEALLEGTRSSWRRIL